MTLRVIFERDDLQRVRVAARPDPMWELVLSLHQIRERRVAARFSAWHERSVASVRAHADARRWLAPLFALVPVTGDFPDFLTPAPPVTELDAGIEELHRTP